MNNKRENQYRQLGLMIAYYRKLKGLTQMQLAELVGVSRTHKRRIWTSPFLWTGCSIFPTH